MADEPYGGMRCRAAIDQLAQLPQRQDALEDQVRDVIVAANKLGCYDAADWIRTRLTSVRRLPPVDPRAFG